MTSVRHLLFLAIVAAGCRSEQEGRAPEPGTELYAIGPADVSEVVLTALDHKLYAYRWSPADPFQIVVATRGRTEIERCVAGDGFQRWLTAVARMPIQHELDSPFDPRGAEWMDLRLRDTTALEPIDVRLRVPSASDEPVVLQSGTRQYAVDLDAAALRRARSGCAALGAAAVAAPAPARR
ncbi:MAG TPA: hypothetical protein VEK77_11300 [Gemmatimonadales bacterium]|nr:hypothetical protein [Gemmatimonadales bacterium]